MRELKRQIIDGKEKLVEVEITVIREIDVDYIRSHIDELHIKNHDIDIQVSDLNFKIEGLKADKVKIKKEIEEYNGYLQYRLPVNEVVEVPQVKPIEKIETKIEEVKQEVKVENVVEEKVVEQVEIQTQEIQPIQPTQPQIQEEYKEEVKVISTSRPAPTRRLPSFRR